jgi:hypothetical protein
MKRNIQLLNTDLTLAQFEDLISTGAVPTQNAAERGKTQLPMRFRGESALPSSPAAAPVKDEGALNSSRVNAPSLMLIDVRRKRFIDGFLVGGLFIALLWVCAFVIIPWLARIL